jgi:hypothetical protein
MGGPSALTSEENAPCSHFGANKGAGKAVIEEESRKLPSFASVEERHIKPPITVRFGFQVFSSSGST